VLKTQICVTRPQCVKGTEPQDIFPKQRMCEDVFVSLNAFLTILQSLRTSKCAALNDFAGSVKGA